jgi:hypothetical protein
VVDGNIKVLLGVLYTLGYLRERAGGIEQLIDISSAAGKVFLICLAFF